MTTKTKLKWRRAVNESKEIVFIDELSFQYLYLTVALTKTKFLRRESESEKIFSESL